MHSKAESIHRNWTHTPKVARSRTSCCRSYTSTWSRRSSACRVQGLPHTSRTTQHPMGLYPEWLYREDNLHIASYSYQRTYPLGTEYTYNKVAHYKDLTREKLKGCCINSHDWEYDRKCMECSTCIQFICKVCTFWDILFENNWTKTTSLIIIFSSL